MKVSVITVAYNAVHTIEDTLRSVASQDYPDVEHIIIDGGSTDGTVDIIERYRQHLAVAVSEPDDGIYDAMNKGIALASGDIIGTLNADDWYADQEVLGRVVDAFNADPGLQAVYGDIVFVAREAPQQTVRYLQSRSYRDGLFEKGWMPPHPTLFVKQDVYQRYGVFDTAFRIQSDFDLCIRLFKVHQIKTRYLPGIMVRMRMGGVTSSSPSNVIKGNIEAYRACRKNGLDVSPLFIARKILSRIPQFFSRPASDAMSREGGE
jgi:glycosyltransferase involved in cell wall biosynthesis